jgi:hypothetical protein
MMLRPVRGMHLASYGHLSPETHAQIGGVTKGVTAIFELANSV